METGGEEGDVTNRDALVAVSFALQYTEELAEGADALAVLVGQDARQLVEVGEVVRGPSGEQLRQGDRAE